MAKKKVSKFREQVAQDTTRQKNAESNYGYLKLPKGLQVFQPEEGRVRLDILPYLVTDDKHLDRDADMDIAVPGELWYKRPFKVHRNIGAENDTVVCLTSFGQRCPICEYLGKRRKEGADQDEIKALRPSQRNLYCVIPIGVKGTEEVPHVWDVSQYLFQNLLNEELDEDMDNAVFPDIEEGLTLRIRFEQQQLGKNKFNEAKRIDFEERTEQYDDSILEDIPNLDVMLTQLSYEEMDAKFLQTESMDSDISPTKPAPERERKKVEKPDDNEDDAPQPARRRKKLPAPDPPDEDEDEELEKQLKAIKRKKVVEPEEEEDEPAPMRKRKRAPEPEEELEPEEEPEDVPPARKRGRNAAPEAEAAPVRKGKKPAADDDEGEEERCPHGHRFGIDCEKFDDCDVCVIWDDCIEAQENN